LNFFSFDRFALLFLFLVQTASSLKLADM